MMRGAAVVPITSPAERTWWASAKLSLKHYNQYVGLAGAEDSRELEHAGDLFNTDFDPTSIELELEIEPERVLLTSTDNGVAGIRSMLSVIEQFKFKFNCKPVLLYVAPEEPGEPGAGVWIIGPHAVFVDFDQLAQAELDKMYNSATA